MELGNRIKFYRLRAKLTQEELCRGICSTSYLSKVENNNMDPNHEIVILLCRKLGVSLELLINANKESLEKKLVQWYGDMKNVDSINETLINKYKDIEAEFSHIDDPILSSTFYIFQMKYLLIIRQYGTLIDKINNLTKYQSLFTSELTFFYHYFIGLAYYHLHRFKDAELKLELALTKLDLLPKNEACFQDELADIYFYLSLCHGKLLNTHQTRQYAMKSLKISNESLDYLKQIKLYILLGINEGRISNFKIALNYYEGAKKIALMTNQKMYLGTINHNIGYLFSNQEKPKEAITFYKESLLYTSPKNFSHLIPTYYCLAKEYLKLNLIKEMNSEIRKGVKLLEVHPIKDYKYHYRVLDLLLKDDVYSSRNYIKTELLPHFKEKQQWNYVAEYAEVLAASYERNIRYKEASTFYKIAYDAQKKIK